MTFLQLLSTHSSQNLTYHCRNSVANYDATDRSYKKALKILGWNDIELNAMGKKRFKYEVTEDECKVSKYYVISFAGHLKITVCLFFLVPRRQLGQDSYHI